MFARVCGCGRAVPSGQRCKCKPIKPKTDNRPGASARGYDGDWAKTRNRYLAAHLTCVRCGEPAKVADHIIPVRQAPHRRLDIANLQGLCVACHASWKQSAERRGSKFKSGAYGLQLNLNDPGGRGESLFGGDLTGRRGTVPKTPENDDDFPSFFVI
jgi:5-methylcytosine-specific restriction enzyme A